MKARIAIAAFTLSSLGAIAATNMSASGDTAQLAQIQQALNDKGFNAGPADGQMGTKTKAALKQFQQKQGLQASGQLDSQTLAALSIQAKDASQPSSSEATTMSQPTTPETPASQPVEKSGKSGFSPQS